MALRRASHTMHADYVGALDIIRCVPVIKLPGFLVCYKRTESMTILPTWSVLKAHHNAESHPIELILGC